MLKGLAFGIVTLGLFASAAVAEAPLTSPRPVPRPIIILLSPSATLAPLASIRPKARPVLTPSIEAAVKLAVIEKTIEDDAREAAETPKQPIQKTTAASQAAVITSPFAVFKSLFPKKRPKGLRVASIDPKNLKAGKAVRYRKKGSVCGIKGIRGYSVPRVRGKISGCGIDNPVKISEVDGVKLTKEALVGCDAAKSLYSWVRNSAKPLIGRRGGGMAKIQVVVSYACRNRNSAKKGRLSEHAKGKAIDITGFVLKNGDTLSVKRDWRTASKGKTLKKLHKAACGPFGTVLGPNANRYHQDHFHFDVASYRSGAYCR